MSEENNTNVPTKVPDGQGENDTPKESKKKKVKVNLPKLRGEKDQTVWACVNGKGILIQRGKDVLIDPEYAEVLKHSKQADDLADEFLAGLEDGN